MSDKVARGQGVDLHSARYLHETKDFQRSIFIIKPSVLSLSFLQHTQNAAPLSGKFQIELIMLRQFATREEVQRGTRVPVGKKGDR